MNIKPHYILISLFCFFLISASAQEKSKKCRPAITDSKNLIGTLKLNERETIEIVGKATYTVTALNSDDTLVGTFVLALADAERQKIAQALNKQLSDIPSTIDQQGVIAQFAKLTECPVLQLDFPAMGLEIAGAKLQLKRFKLNLKEKDETPTLMLCTIAHQMNGIRGRMNLRAFNERLNCLKEKD